MGIFQWLNDPLLRMDWLSWLVRLLVEDVSGVDMASRLGGSLHLFMYDAIKIFILLSVLIFGISWVQSYFPPERSRRILSGMRGFRANLTGAPLGRVTPFCSCSSIPLFIIGFTSSGSLAIAYVLAVLGRTLIGKARMEQYVEAFVTQHKVLDLPQEQLTLRDRPTYARDQVAEGVGLGAVLAFMMAVTASALPSRPAGVSE